MALRYRSRFGLGAALLIAMSSSVAGAGDRDYGAYLAQECQACHRSDGADNTIPPIAGWDEISFTVVMHSYQSGDRESEVMGSVARSLDQEQIAALAAYFSTKRTEND